MSKCYTTYFQNNLLIVTTKNNILGFTMLYNEVKPITILRSEKNKSKNLGQDFKNTGYIKGQDKNEY